MDGLTILTIDDDQDLLTLISHLLAKKQHRVIQAESGEKALEILSDTKPDLILLDVMMQDMTGYEVCAKLQEDENLAFIPVIFLTALSSEEDRARAFSLGAVDFLTKPIEKSLLYQVIEKHATTEGQWRRFLDTKKQKDTARKPYARRSFPAYCKFLFEFLNIPDHEHPRLIAMDTLSLAEAIHSSHGLDAKRFAILVAQFTGLDYMSKIEPGKIQLDTLPPKFSRHNRVVAVSHDKGIAFVVADPFNTGLMDILETMKPKKFFVSTPDAVMGQAEPVTFQGENIDRLVNSVKSLYLSSGGDDADTGDLDDDVAYQLRVDLNASPLVRFVNTFIEKAYNVNASDIHIEPMENRVVIRYRIDGELKQVHQLRPRKLINVIASRIKIMAKMDISERRIPQDGRFAFKEFTDSAMDFDVRVSSAPMNYGEKIVMRILDKKKALLPLDRLGFSPDALKRYRSQIKAPYGMVLHVGPTGSGKSMSLYSALNEVNRPNINIQTAEDPIEYTLNGISQMQINPLVGLGFKEALRCFLRQDPDTILLGEIRDEETAGVAVEAALTGHLLFSTMHTNDAPSTIARFFEMGIAPYMISSSIVLICAQRLLRRLCPTCKTPYEPDAGEKKLAGLPPDAKVEFYKPVGCLSCSGTGYKGRIGCYELLIPTNTFRDAIGIKRISTESIRKIAISDCGMVPLFQDAIEKVTQGITSMAEAMTKAQDINWEPSSDD